MDPRIGDELTLQGRTALVTGSSTGIGAASAKRLAAAGATVGVTYRSSEEAAHGVVKAIEREGGRAILLEVDVAQEASVTDLFDRFQEEAGPLDILIANAGLQQDAPLADMTLEQWRTVIDVDLTGQFLCVREAIRHFNRKPWSPGDPARGSIVCMSSVHEFIPWAGHVNYAAAKGGVQMLMKSAAQEVASRGIRINGLAPGAIATDINAAAREAGGERLLELIPYGRVGQVEEVARAAHWLVSDAADYVIGTTLVIDGGMSLYPGFIGNG